MRVSVIMPVYNAAPYLERAIQSVLDQPEVVELILIDDASTDGSDAIARRWAQRESRIEFLPAQQSEPQRAAAARNRGLAAATAPFIAFLDADDYYLPNRFTRTARYFETHPEVEGLVEPVEVRYEGDLSVQNPKYQRNSCWLDGDGWKRATFVDLIAPGMQMNGLTLRRAIFERMDGFDTALNQVQDLDLGRRLIFNDINRMISGCKMPAVATYSHHQSNTTNRIREKWVFSAILEIRWLRRLAADRSTRAHRRRLFYRYVVFKYQSPPWPRWKKGLLYPFIFAWEAVHLGRFLR